MATKKKSSISTVHKSSADMTPWLGIAFIIILVDQLTKITVNKLFTYGETRPVTDFFNLVLVYNPGAAFSFLGDQGGWQRWFFTAIGVVAIGFMLYMLKRHPGQRLFCWALALILGGAVGNVIDRIAYGHVVDFLDFYWRGWGHFPAFNVADIGISIGAFLFIVDELRRVNKN
ncbi:signal peptidase II [Massilia niabensis]|uniref:Lipoprotein signal peptidase n=1 Tax=Massilia niabensis TaxID=544910 RepID=A0ABW0L9B6_9BURK